MDPQTQKITPEIPQQEEKKKSFPLKKVVLIFLGIVVICAISITSYVLMSRKTPKPELTQKNMYSVYHATATPTPTPLPPETMEVYTNTKAGFSIGYPTKVLDMTCDGNKYINPSTGTLIALDDPAHNIVHFTVADEGFPMHSPKKAPGGYTYYDLTGCTTVHVTLENINTFVDLGMGDDNREHPRNDIFYYQTVNSEEDAVSFMENKFGLKDCAIDTRKDLGEKNGIDFRFSNSQGGECYRYKVRYSSQKHLAITWLNWADQPMWSYNGKAIDPDISFQ